MRKYWLKLLVFASLLALILSASFSTTNAAPMWVVVDPNPYMGYWNSLALSPTGNPVIAYRDVNYNLKLAICGDPTCSLPAALIDLQLAGDMPSLELSGLNPIVSYYRMGQLHLLICGDPTCTSKTVRTFAYPGGIRSSLELTAAGNPVITHYKTDTGANGDLGLVVCHDPTCSTTPTERTLDSVGDVGNASSLVLNGDNPVISYYDATNGDLKLIACGDPLCEASVPRILDGATSDVGWSTSLQLGGGNPVTAYIDGTNDTMKLAVCSDSICSTGPTITTIDSVGSSGAYVSLQLNNGNPVISYYSSNNMGDLKLAVCHDPTCSSAPTITVPDGNGSVGEYTSLRLNNGTPVIAYRHSDSGNLRLYTDYTPPTCYIDAPATVDEGATFTATVTCSGITQGVYGFELGMTGIGNATTSASSFAPGSFIIDAGAGNAITGADTLANYAVSRAAPATVATGSFTLGSVDYTVGQLINMDGTFTLHLEKLLLGDIDATAITDIPITTDRSVTLRNLFIATASGQVRSDLRSAAITEVRNARVDMGGQIYTAANTSGGTVVYTFGANFTSPSQSFSADMDSHLICYDTVTIVDGSNTIPILTLKAGDVADDGSELTAPRIDIVDALAIGLVFNGTADAEQDVNKDGVVNIFDLISVGRNYGSVAGLDSCGLS